MKKRFLILVTFMLFSCNKNISSIISSSDVIDSTSNISSSTNMDNREFQININDFSTNNISNDNIEFLNCQGNVETSGSISKKDNAYRIGSTLGSGNVSIIFENEILAKQIYFNALPNSKAYSQTITYNENSSFTFNLSNNVNENYYVFEQDTLIKSISFSCSGNKSMLFKGIRIIEGTVIDVSSISVSSSISGYTDRFVDLSSSYNIIPENATYKEVEFICDNENVEIKDNKFRASKKGTYEVTIRTKNKEHKASLKIDIQQGEPLNAYYKQSSNRFSYQDYYDSYSNISRTPSVGEVNVIVVPVNFSDLLNVYDFNNKESMERLNAVFNGDKEDNTNDYYESVKSFYKKSSYGKLDFNFEIVDPYTPSFTSEEFLSIKNDYGAHTYALLEDFYYNAKIDGQTVNFHDKKYDADNDGIVDGVWLIYNDNRSSTSQNYWPFSHNFLSYDSNINFSKYANASVYFTYEENNQGLDGHTLFHETGHMLGLLDYYVTTNSGIGPLGGLDMMDYNIGDHNPYSKMILDWVTPYVVTGESDIEISSFVETGDFILIPSASYNQSAFSEFIAVEFYTPTSLNKFDGDYQYGSVPKYFTDYGIRIYHVDSRLISSNNVYLSSSETNFPTNYVLSTSNTSSSSRNGFFTIEAITRNNVSTYFKETASNASLFKQGDIMDPRKYTSFFKNGIMFHDGSNFNYTIEVLKMNNEKATIRITNF